MTNLVELASQARCERLRRYAAYYDGASAYSGRKFDWDGSIGGYHGPIQAGHVPMSRRRPDVIYDLPRLIVRRFTAFGFGEMPKISCPGDDETERFYRAVIKEARLFAKLTEARNNGGACGTAVSSLAYVRGKPRVRVHHARNVHVLRWIDKYAQEVGQALEVVVSQIDGKPHYHVREWTEETETVWEPIPQDRAERSDWRGSRSYTVRHGFGFAPLVWCQNLPSDDSADGEPDCRGLFEEGIFDAINELASQQKRALCANLDPTLVIKMDPTILSSKRVKKGDGNVIFSPQGAAYLELSGKSGELASAQIEEYRQHALDSTGLVLPDEKVGGSGLSAAALKIRYQPTIAACNVLRSQYADDWLLPVLRGLWRMAQTIQSSEPGALRSTEDGRVIEERPSLQLDPVPVDGELVDPLPGESERVEIKWPEYFPSSPDDDMKRVQTANAARGSLVCDETAVKYTASLFGVVDPVEEAEKISEEEDVRLEKIPAVSFGGGNIED